MMPILTLMRLAVLVFSMCMLTSAGFAQTTRPADAAATPGTAVPTAWEREITSLAAAAAAHDAQTIQSLAGPNCQVRQFNSDHDQDISDFTDFATSDSVLGSHAYIFPSAAIAADIASDVNSCTEISDFLKKEMALEDKQSQSIVMQWLTVSLNVQDGALIGVVVLWDSRPEAEDQHRLMFILVKGKKTDAGFAMTQIVYGDPLAAN
jgi:hypothetical protein